MADDIRAKIAARRAALSGAAPQPQPEESPGVARSVLEGAKQGLTFSFADELAGAEAAGLAKLSQYRPFRRLLGADLPAEMLATPEEAYKEARDAERAALEKSRAAHPVATFGGQIAGGALLPVGYLGAGGKTFAQMTQAERMAAGFSTGVASGALGGAGEAKELADIPMEASKGVIGGAVVGPLAAAAVPAVTEAATRAGRKAAEKIAGTLGADTADLATLSSLRGSSQPLDATQVARQVEGKLPGQPPVRGGIKKAADTVVDYGIVSPLGTTESAQKNAQRVFDEAANAKQALMEEATKAGAIVDPADVARRMMDQASQLRAQGGRGAEMLAADIEQEAADIALNANRTAARAPMTIDAAADEARRAGSRVGKWDNPYKNDVEKLATRSYREAVDDAVEQALGDATPDSVLRAVEKMRGGKPLASTSPADVYRELRTVQQVAGIAEDQAARGLGRQASNRYLGLLELEAGNVGAQLAGAPGAMAGAALVKTAKKFGPQSSAFAARTARDVQRRAMSGAPVVPSAYADRLRGMLEDATRAVGEPDVAGVRGAAAALPSAIETPAMSRREQSPSAQNSKQQQMIEEMRQQGYSDDEIALLLGM